MCTGRESILTNYQSFTNGSAASLVLYIGIPVLVDLQGGPFGINKCMKRQRVINTMQEAIENPIGYGSGIKEANLQPKRISPIIPIVCPTKKKQRYFL